MTEQPQPQKEAAFFTTIRQWGLTRGDNGVVGGVVEGLGARVGLAAVPARLIVVITWLLLSGLVMLAYAAAWGLLPDRRGNIIIQNFGRGVTNVGALLGIAILTLFGFGALDGGPVINPLGWGGSWMWDNGGMFGDVPGFGSALAVMFAITIPLLVISGVIVLIVWLVKRSKDATPPTGTPGADGWAATPDAPAGSGAPHAAGAGAGPAAAGAPANERARASAGDPNAVYTPQPWEPALAPGDPRVANVAGPAPTPPPPGAPPAPGASAPPAPAAPPAPPAPAAPYAPPRPHVPGPGKGGYLAALGVLLVAAAVVIGIERADQLAVNPVLAWGAIVTVGLGAVLIVVALTGRKLGFLGFLSVLAVLAGVPLAANADEIRADHDKEWGWWDVDVTIGDGPTVTSATPTPVDPVDPVFDATSAFDDYAEATILPGCYSISQGGGPSDPYELGARQSSIRIGALSGDQTLELGEGTTRLTIPEGMSVEILGSGSLLTTWPERDLGCDFSSEGSETWLQVVREPGDSVLRIQTAEASGLYIHEEQS